METKKLTAKDLMIGDWVQCVDSTHEEKTYAQIDAIEEGQTCILVRKDNCNWFLDIGFIEAIPLTAEILEKNGFTRLGTNYILEGEHFGLDNPSNPNNYLDNYWLRISINAVKIEYVEQLQHALRLCGINDKEIVL